jgi:hypothetical protein
MSRLIVADASKVSGSEFLRAITGRPPRDRAAEAAYLEAENAHWRTAKAESDAMVRQDGETALAFLIRKLKPLYDHDDWRREQERLWSRGEWQAPEQKRRAA